MAVYDIAVCMNKKAKNEVVFGFDNDHLLMLDGNESENPQGW